MDIPVHRKGDKEPYALKQADATNNTQQNVHALPQELREDAFCTLRHCLRDVNLREMGSENNKDTKTRLTVGGGGVIMRLLLSRIEIAASVRERLVREGGVLLL